MPPPLPSALFVSPHLDDVAFSCGGALATLARAGWETALCTVFTRSVPDPRGFALACQLDKGLGPEVDYMGLRRAEDREAARALGASRVVWLDLPEAPHRGYGSAPALFGDLARGDRIGPEVEAALRPLVAAHDLTFAPQGLGRHVDHRHVRDAVAALARPGRALWYRDLPYAARDPAAEPEPPAAAATPVAIPLDVRALAAKLDACAAYASQLGFQFGGETPMRARLAAFAREEAARAGLPADAAAELARVATGEGAPRGARPADWAAFARPVAAGPPPT